MSKNFLAAIVSCCLVLLLTHTASGASHSTRRDGVTVSQNSKLRNRLRKQFGFPLPSSARIECTNRSADRRVLFVCVRMSPSEAARFKEKLIQSRRPVTQRFVYEDKDSIARIGDIPAGNEPKAVETWKVKNDLTGCETLIKIQNQQRLSEDELKTLSYLVMFSSESKGLAYFYLYPA